MVVDGHSHLFQRAWPADHLPQSAEDLETFDLEGLIAGLDEIRVDRVVTLAQEMTRIRDQWLGSNMLTADLQRRCPDRMVGIAGAEPFDRADQFCAARLEEIERLAKEEGIRGVLFTPPYGHYFANDPRAYPFYAKAVELDISIYFH